jgi:uncharacterized protein (DUF885 family)
LRERFISRLGWKRFHSLLLESGEIPFRLATRRLEHFIDEELAF